MHWSIHTLSLEVPELTWISHPGAEAGGAFPKGVYYFPQGDIIFDTCVRLIYVVTLLYFEIRSPKIFVASMA